MFLNEAFQIQYAVAHTTFNARLAQSILVFINLTTLCSTTLFTSTAPPLVFDDSEDLADMTPEERDIFEQSRLKDDTTDSIKSEANASIFHRMFLLWIMPLLRRGYRRALKFSDLPPLAVNNTAHVLSEISWEVWQAEKSREGKYPLFRTLWRTVGWKYALNGFFRLANIFLRFGSVRPKY
jgi:hypothetical protein